MTTNYRVKRLGPHDGPAAKGLFSMMAAVVEEEHDDLSDAYVDALLAREDTWVLAAFSADEIVGGLTAHVLPMTRSESRELFIYDIAVRTDQQRQGVGRHLVRILRQLAADAGLRDVFVLADNEDDHALEFYRALRGVASPVTAFTFASGG